MLRLLNFILSKLNIINFVTRVSRQADPKFFILLLSNYLCLKGATLLCINAVQLPFYKGLGYTGSQYQIYQTIASVPWSSKGFIGALSDSFPIGGYNKRYYIVLAACGGIIALLILTVTPIEAFKTAPGASTLLFVFINLQIATADLLCEGKYSELMAKSPDIQSDMVTFVWMCIQTGSLFGALMIGPLSDHFGPRSVFLVCLPFVIQGPIPALLGYMPEVKASNSQARNIESSKILEKKRCVTLACVIATSAIGLALFGFIGNHEMYFLYAIASSAVACFLSLKFLEPTLAECNLYMFFQELLYINLQGPIDFWYTADTSCVTDGPHFDYTYYQTYTLTVGIFAAGIGLWIFQTYLSKRNFRYVFVLVVSLRIFASVIDMIIVKRINIWFGLSDKWTFLIGDGIILNMCAMLNLMPLIILTAKLCPPSMESTMYAILAGFQNFGVAVSKAIGVFVSEKFRIDAKKTDCNFDNLTVVIFLCHMLAPMLTIPLVFKLIPNVSIDSFVLHSTSESNTPGVAEPMEEDEFSKTCEDGQLFAISDTTAAMYAFDTESSVTNSFEDENQDQLSHRRDHSNSLIQLTDWNAD